MTTQEIRTDLRGLRHGDKIVAIDGHALRQWKVVAAAYGPVPGATGDGVRLYAPKGSQVDHNLWPRPDRERTFTVLREERRLSDSLYRWECPCGDHGRWLRDPGVARHYGANHAERRAPRIGEGYGVHVPVIRDGHGRTYGSAV